jgi:hypothetical protein
MSAIEFIKEATKYKPLDLEGLCEAMNSQEYIELKNNEYVKFCEGLYGQKGVKPELAVLEYTKDGRINGDKIEFSKAQKKTVSFAEFTHGLCIEPECARIAWVKVAVYKKHFKL